MKILFIILDGLGDRPIKKLGNRTPLEAARTPNLDFLAKEGLCGLIKPVYQGSFPTSKDAHLSLFGYDLRKWAMGRGVFEVLGIGMELKKTDVALRGNLASVDAKMKIIKRRASRTEDLTRFIKPVQGLKIDGIKFLVGPGTDYRLGVIMRGRGLSEKVSDNDLHITAIRPQKVRPLDRSKEAEFTARVLNKFLQRTHLILENHPLNQKRKKQGSLPVNYILLRTAGRLKPIPPFQQKWGLRACCVAGAGLYKGIARVLGMDLLKVKGATGDEQTNLEGKIKTAKRALKKYNFCFLHIKATDDFSHDGDFMGKKRFIERIDRHLKNLLDLKDALIIVTGDHSTPCALKQHSADALPVLVWGDQTDGVEKFSEKACQKGGLGKIKSIDLLKRFASIKRVC